MTRFQILLVALLALLGVQSSTSPMAATGRQLTDIMSPSVDAPESLSNFYQLASTKKKKKNMNCPDGLTRNPDTGECRNPCSHNDHWENGTCVPCAPGSHEETQKDDNGDDQQVCAANTMKKANTKSCPEGKEFKNGKCRKSEFPPIAQCSDNQRLDPASGSCFSCSHNDHFDANGKCVPCQEGMHVEGDACVAD